MLTTRTKTALARVASLGVLGFNRIIGRGPTVEVERGGVRWALDLREGIDFSIYLLGSFEPATVRAYTSLVRAGDTVLDIGANIGAHTLRFASLVGEHGQVHAFEPTEYAFAKLRRNIELNAGLEAAITAVQVALVDHENRELPSEIYSSWPLTNDPDLHETLRGRLKSTSDARVCTLDEYCRSTGIARVNLLKLDVDGFECAVLRGARETLAEHRPVIIVELMPHGHGSGEDSFESMIQLLRDAGYAKLQALGSGQALPLDPGDLRRSIPSGAGLNALATVT